MKLIRLAPLVAAALILAACSGSAGATATAAPTPSSAPSATRVAVTLTDALRIEPAQMKVPVGIPVTFVVTNAGALEHEFYLGDEAAQAEHERDMAAAGGMKHDEPEGIALMPGTTKELTYTFQAPGAVLAGCHVTGHYLAGMKAAITVG